MFTRSRPLYTRLVRAYSETAGSSAKPPGSSPSVGIKADVPGLSSNCIKPLEGKLGPGASHSGEYKVPEYFAFTRFSYAEAEVEMAKFRLPQPSPFAKSN